MINFDDKFNRKTSQGPNDSNNYRGSLFARMFPEKEYIAKIIFRYGKELYMTCGDTIAKEDILLFKADIEEMEIPEGVTKIEKGTFAGCVSLKKIVIPDSVTEISDGAFLCCENLADVKMSKNVTKIGESAFSSCYNLSQINLPESVKEIGRSAFFCCSSLTEISIPKDVTKIDIFAFSNLNTQNYDLKFELK